MLTVDFDSLMLELKEGVIKNVGPANTDATVKLYDVEAAEAREFGDERVKLAFADGEGNEVEVALFPEEAAAIRAGIEELEAESRVFE
ncbi:MAG: hypothetical protein V5A85_10685 [Haloarculaceae archaeon]